MEFKGKKPKHEVRKTLQEIINQQGEQILEDLQNIRKSIVNTMSQEHLERSLIVIALDTKVPHTLLKQKDKTSLIEAMKQLTYRLYNNRGIDLNFAWWA
ncbi:MAG: hypothetical protein QXS29_10465, partial [Nitrososphaeria archaeon]